MNTIWRNIEGKGILEPYPRKRAQDWRKASNHMTNELRLMIHQLVKLTALLQHLKTIPHRFYNNLMLYWRDRLGVSPDLVRSPDKAKDPNLDDHVRPRAMKHHASNKVIEQNRRRFCCVLERYTNVRTMREILVSIWKRSRWHRLYVGKDWPKDLEIEFSRMGNGGGAFEYWVEGTVDWLNPRILNCQWKH